MTRMPAVFFGHGNPMNALADNAWTRVWAQLGNSMPRPRAVLAISAHWYVPYTAVTAMAQPRTIHDFGGFPRALHEVKYPAPGSAALAARVQELLAPRPIPLDDDWGLDHGTWAVLCHVYPQADVPVVQLSIDETQPPRVHFELGRQLAPLREEGILIAGSGNLVHNLHTYAWGREGVGPFEWAQRFENAARERILASRDDELVDYERLDSDALLSVPTPEHYLPLLYVLGTRDAHDTVGFPVEGIDGGSVSMLSVRVG
jgi:4,5-DOPA dioxygenase extradiol